MKGPKEWMTGKLEQWGTVMLNRECTAIRDKVSPTTLIVLFHKPDPDVSKSMRVLAGRLRTSKELGDISVISFDSKMANPPFEALEREQFLARYGSETA